MSDDTRHDRTPERQRTGNASTREDATLLEKVLEDSPHPDVHDRLEAERKRAEERR